MPFPVSSITIPRLAGVIPCSVYCSSEQRYDRVSAMYVRSLSGFRDKSSSFRMRRAYLSRKKHPCSETTIPFVALWNKNDRPDGWRMKKNVIVMRNEKNILKQNSLPSGIIIKSGLRVAGLALCLWLISQVSISTSTVVGLIFCYWGICLVFKVVRFIIRLILSLLSVAIITALILLIL